MPILGIIASSYYTPPYPTTSTAIGTMNGTSPFVNIYAWSTSGVGTKYSNPSDFGTSGYFIAFNRTRTAVTISSTVSPYVLAYPWSSSTGFGTKFSNPTTLPTAEPGFYNQSFSDDTLVMNGNGNALMAFPFSASSGFGTKYANPSTLPSSVAQPVFNTAGTVVFAGSQTPNIIAYAWSGGFGSKYADPASPPNSSGATNAASVSPAGDAVIVGYTTGDYSTGTAGVWAFSGGWGSKYANPSPAIGNYYGATGTGFNSAGTSIGISHYAFDSDKIMVWPWSSGSGFGTKYTSPTINANDGRGFGFANNGTGVAYMGNSGPILNAWQFSSGFGTKSADPSPAITGIGKSIQFG